MVVETRSKKSKGVKRGTMPISDLPLDLQSNILSKVPPKSLAQLQITSKTWYELFKDPEFVKEIMGKSARESMLLMNLKLHSVSIDHVIHDDTIDASMELRGKLSSRKKSERVNISDIFYSNGVLVCTTKGNKTLVVWNPCNGETRLIGPRTRYTSNDSYALGSGKILRCYCGDDLRRTVSEFEMYEFSSDSWRVLEVDTHDWEIRSPGVSFKGNAYWIAKDRYNKYDYFILGFDFETERFKRIRLPYRSDGPNQIRSTGPEVTAVLSVVREEKLAVLHQYLHRKSLKMKIWVTDVIETKEVTWSKFLVVNLEEFVSELGSSVEVVSFLVEEESKVAVCCSLDVRKEEKMTRVFIVGEGQHKQVYEGTTLEDSWPLLLDYAPSLAHIPKNKPNGKRKRKQ